MRKARPPINSLLVQFVTRLSLLAAFLFALTLVDNQRKNPPPSTLPTDNFDLQIVRLYQRTNGQWTDADQEELNRLLTAQNNIEMISRRLPFMPSPSVPVLWAVAQQQRATQDWQRLEQTLRTILSSDPAHTGANLWLGLLLLPDTDGVRHVQIASSTPHEQQPLAAAVLGIVSVEGYTPADVALRLVEAGEWAFAERFLTQQIEQNNLDAWAYAYRGYVRDQQNRNGLSDIQQAISLEPTLSIGFYMLGLHERSAGNLPASLNALQEAYLLEPDNPALAAEVAAGYQLAQDRESAEEWFGLAVSLAPDDVRFVRLQAAFYAENAYLLDGRGLDFIQKASEQYPEDVHLLASLGRAYLENERLADAEAALQRAFLLAPEDARTHYFLGNLAENRGNIIAALEHYSAVILTKNPYTEQALEALRRLS